MEERYSALAEKMVDRIKDDRNILAILVYGSVATNTLSEGSDIDLLLLVKDMPEDVDIFGIKRTEIEGVDVDLAHKTVEQVQSQIDFEAGAWYSSSVMLNSRILYDPDGIAEGLRRRILEMPEDRREFIFNCLMEDARTYPNKIRQSIELGDFRGSVYLMRIVVDSLVQVMFMSNRTRPASEKGMVRDFVGLSSLPNGFVKSYDFVEGFDSVDGKKAEEMLEFVQEMILAAEKLWKAKNS